MLSSKLAVIIGLAIVGTLAAYMVFGSAGSTSFRGAEDSNLQTLFTEWKTKYNKAYGGPENKKRFHIFAANYYQIQNHNAKDLPWSLAVNQFADLTHDEFSNIYLGYRAHLQNNNESGNESNSNLRDVPDSIDWRQKGAVTPVKNQAQCGSCWAFSTTGALEGAYFIKTGELVSFSEQQLVDCSGSYGNQGCNGGLMDNAFEYVQAQGIMKESDYPYKGVDGKCKYDASKVVAKVTGHTDVTPDNSADLMAAVAQGPVSIAIEADQSVFQFYNKGVITTGCGTGLDHGVLLVGYDNTAKTPYWIVKNSWGADWGLDGYVQIAIGSQNNGAGECGINSDPSYPQF